MSQGPQARTVGARLREAREKRGVSLRQIADSTRISVMSLEALERSDLARLPGGIFTRAFIRAYAEEVGLDPDQMIEDFVAELPPEALAGSTRSGGLADGEKLESDRKAVATAFWLIVASLPIAGLLIYYGLRRAPGGRPPAPDERAPASTSSIAVDAPPPVPAASLATPAAPAVAPATIAPVVIPAAAPLPTGLAMEIAPRAECWVSVTVDGEQMFSGVMHAGDKRQVTAHDEISLSVGDAGAFAYTLNGKEGRPLGAPGEAVSKRIKIADLKEYVTP
jgi:cytoskeleton protein RodZ